MKRFSPKIAIAMGGVLAFGLGVVGPASAAETPQRGGVLNFVVGSKIPSYDGHRETTFGVIHPLAPFYSVLIRVNPITRSRQQTLSVTCARARFPRRPRAAPSTPSRSERVSSSMTARR